LTTSQNTETSKTPPLERIGEAFKNIAIFASGAGSNAKVIIEAAQKNNVHYKVSLIVSNNPTAGVLAIAKQNNIPSLIIEKDNFFNNDFYLYLLQQHKIDYIVLAGFLWKVPVYLINAFTNKIINIHPALLPKYGGKGMYGHYVHQAVVANKETQSGISIHLVDEIYDNGKILFQASCAVTIADNADTVAAKIHELEHLHYWKIVDGWVINAG
jgi:phosphoribosylglycinamide formyltransferase-1